MRILMLNNEFPPRGGGTGTVNRELLFHFAKASDLEIDLITSGNGSALELEQFSAKIKICKVRVGCQNIHHASNRELVAYAYRAFCEALSTHRKHPYDFCFAWSAVPAGIIALALRRICGLRYMVRVSGPDIPGFENRYKWIYPIITPFIRAVWTGAEIIVAKCEKEKEMIQSIHSRMRTLIIPNGVDLGAFASSAFSEEQNPFRIICVGRLIERKGQKYLIEAIKRLDDYGERIILNLIGTGDALSSYKNLARDFGIEHLVRFHGYIPHEKIAAYYAASDVFVLPSYNEGMSVASLEAMAAGLPIIATKTGGTDELIGEGVNGFIFEWGDIESLTKHLRHLISDRDLTHRMGLASRARAARFSWEMPAKTYLDLFEAIYTRSGVPSNG
jgi:phosphatidyl-myo-inositol dimannoside synthase